MQRVPVVVLSACVVFSPFVVSAPVAAATLPADDDLFTISCAFGDEAAQLYGIDGDSADATAIGPTGVADCASGAAYDPTTATSYYFSYALPAGLNRIDTATGAATAVAPLPNLTVGSIAIGIDGDAFAIEDGPADQLTSLDLATGARVPIGPLFDAPNPDSVRGFSVDPTTGLFYLVMIGSGDVYRVDVATADLTLIGNVGPGVSALQIDTAGHWWFIFIDPLDPLATKQLFSSPLPDGDTTPELEGDIDTDGGEQDVFAFTLLLTYPPPPPPPVLPVSGPGDVGAASAVALALLLAGVLLSRSRRRGTEPS